MLKFYDARSALGLASHYAGMATIAAAATYMAPLWLSVSVIAYQLYRSKETLIKADIKFKNLKPHPPSHKYSPNLQSIIDDLYDKSGLDRDKNVIYSFQDKAPDPKKDKSSTSLKLDHFKQYYNAMAFHYDQPRFMISEPLLEILTDEEERAVLAHEFIHGVAGHTYTKSGMNLLEGVTKATNNLNLLSKAVTLGILKFGISAAGGSALMRIAAGRFGERNIGLRASLVGASLGVIGASAYYVPGFASVFGAATLLNIGTTFMNKSFSRSMEYQADRKVTDLGASPVALITALRKVSHMSVEVDLSSDDLDNKKYSKKVFKGVLQSLHTHPALEKRMEQLKQVAITEGYDSKEIDEAINGPLDVGDISHIPRTHIEGMAQALLGNSFFKDKTIEKSSSPAFAVS